MKNFCLSSSVSNFYTTINADLCRRLVDDYDEDNNCWPFLIIADEKVSSLVFSLDKEIRKILYDYKPNEFTTSLLKFKGQSYKINLRNHLDFELACKVQLYNAAALTLNFRSHLWLFNNELLEKYHGGSIIAYLRGHILLSEKEIFEGINSLWQKLKLNKSISLEAISLGLENLIKYGLVYKDEIVGEYSVTATGYMYR
ncbi:hypothetical protein [Pedobacter sp. KLB.chiD]|uniref:hypothetical protein n=1 Tax=Pedobacter sp. KLB.chiD TaxID=3387402 RepID=UPI00399AE411